ncbi:ankyrin repeat domain-containing protein [Martelella alba]|uniref:ankyrin repeat domain-containing protein n=1 Tax=Martelella alba TaxID=2590451 RepID=UPI0014858429|nr:ankyrin repeat domain-containing protein [Martelella alba]
MCEESILNRLGENDALCLVNPPAMGLPRPVIAPNRLDNDYSGENNELHSAIKRRDNLKAISPIESGADVNSAEPGGRTPLHMATLENNSVLIDALLKHGARTDALDASGNTALHLAIICDKGKAFESLSDKSNKERSNNDLNTPLHEALRHHRHAYTVKLLASGVNIEARDGVGRAPLMLAVMSGDSPQIAQLLARDPDLEATDHHFATAEDIAVECRRDLALQQLIRYRNTFGTLQNDANIPLVKAIESKRFDYAQKLISFGAELDIRNQFKRTPLMLAVLESNEELVMMLLENDVDIDAIDFHNNTALHIATLLERRKEFDILMKYHPKLDLIGYLAKTPYMNAVDNDNPYMIARLREAGADTYIPADSSVASMTMSGDENHFPPTLQSETETAITQADGRDDRAENATQWSPTSSPPSSAANYPISFIGQMVAGFGRWLTFQDIGLRGFCNRLSRIFSR